MARPLTQTEAAQLVLWWPHMNAANIVVSGEKDDAYNCLAWTLGITNSWVWPWSTPNVTKAQFDALYRSHGFDPSASGEIAAFGNVSTDMLHGSISGARHGPRWESKCGRWLRIQHGLGEMEGGEYGKVIGFYKTRAITSISALGEGTMASQPGEENLQFKLSQDEQDFLRAQVNKVDPNLQTAFEQNYQLWKVTWEQAPLVFSSNPNDYTKSPEFFKLIALGPGILPLLMAKLQDAGEFLALQAIQQITRSEVFEPLELDDPRVLLGEQGRALIVLKRWISFES